MAISIPVNPFRGTIGLPPHSHISDDEIINSMPIAKITPGKPSWGEGLSLFQVTPDWDSYNTLLKNHGYKIDSQPIKVAYLADNFPTDSFTNEYNETFLQGITQAASSGLGQISQIMGERDVMAAARVLADKAAISGAAVEGVMGDLLKGGAGFISSAISGAEGVVKGLQTEGGLGGILGKGAGAVSALLAGHRIDFPKVWSNSGFEPSYTMTVRLYNPNPGNNDSIKKYIIGPLAVLLCLALPRDPKGNGSTYSWPFFHRIQSEGIYDLNPAVITNVTVIKGGDQQQISHAQTMGIVDVRLDFGSVFSTLLAEEEEKQENRPTLNNYLNAMEKKFQVITRNNLQISSAKAAGVPDASARRTTEEDLIVQNIVDKAVSARQGVTAPTQTSFNRSPTLAKQEELEAESPLPAA